MDDGGLASAIAIVDGDSDTVLVGSDNGFIYRSSSATTSTETTTWSSTRPRAGRAARG